MPKIPNRTLWISLAVVAAVCGCAADAGAQTLRLRQAGSGQNTVSVQVGQVIDIEVFADLQGVSSAGIAFYLSVPEGAFVVNDLGLPGQAGTQPFRMTNTMLFWGAQTPTNLLVPESNSVAALLPGQQLDFSAVIGAGSDRNRTGNGVVAVFQLVAVQPIENGQIKIDNNPARETKLFLTDGVSERRFTTTQGMEITATGLQLLDIPDVILQPGQSDSTTIGRLDKYLVNTLSLADSIRWTYEATDNAAAVDSVEITIDPATRRVKVVPVEGWRGRLRLLWTATDPQRASPGQPLLSASEVSTIVVNNRPRYDTARDADGIKRDTVRVVEDKNTFVVGVTNLDTRRAFRSFDLDEKVFDPDVDDPQTQLNFLVLPLPAGGNVLDVNVRGDDATDTHELLVWTRPDFGGTDTLGVRIQGTDTTVVIGGRDSMRVIVQDEFQGRDTLRVIVEVEEVADAPRIIEEELEPRIARGGTKRYVYNDFVEDPDTPIEDLVITWTNDPDEHFIVDTTRTSTEGLILEVKGDPTFTGIGRVVIGVADPFVPALADTAIFFFTSAEALPPDVFPPQIKVDTRPDGLWTDDLDLYVSDPDNADSELRWSIPPVSTSTITIDQDRTISVATPRDFVGYEEVDLTVLDPGNQSDMLKLRIYSSDGRPVAGGLPDLVLDRGEEDRTIDLDEYYHDDNDADRVMIWSAQPTFDTSNLTLDIDPLTHIVTFAVSQRAVFGTETVIFQVTDPGGISASDTMLVTIRTGVDPGGAFSIAPPIPELEAPVGQAVELIHDLYDHILASPSLPKTSISWSVEEGKNNVGLAFVSRVKDATTELGVRWSLRVFSDVSGADTVRFTATDSLGRAESTVTTIRYYGESERLELRSLPDIVFVSGQNFTGLNLNDYILDREAHPDSVMQWSRVDIGSGEGTIFVEIQDDASVKAFSFDIAETQVVFTARDTALGVTGRDTVRVISQDPALATSPLQDFPPLVIEAGGVDSSIALNDYLPEGVEPVQTNWSVSGQSITVPVIDPTAPHRLRVSSVGTTVGTDTLDFRVSLGGGFVATGSMEVTVVEPVDETTLTMRLVPNPLQSNYVDFFVMARTELTSSPTVVVTFEGDTTVAVRQIEDDISARGVLIWAGSYKVRLGASGTLLFRAQAITALGTSVQATSSMAAGTAASGKPLALIHGDTELRLAADALDDGQLVLLQVGAASPDAGSAARPAGLPELALVRRISLWPASLAPAGGARLRFGSVAGGADLYRVVDGTWRWLADGAAAVDDGVAIETFGVLGLLVDTLAPRLEIEDGTDGELVVRVEEGGSGLAADGVFAEIEGGVRLARPLAEGTWTVPLYAKGADDEPRTITIVARDRAGNESRRSTLRRLQEALPTQAVLGTNYPNPFNPETTIPFQLPAASGPVRLRIYNAAGQLVRELLDPARAAVPGSHRVVWDGRNGAGMAVSSGIYFYRLETETRALTRSMTLLK